MNHIKELKHLILAAKSGKFYWHATPKQYIASIMKQGLLPMKDKYKGVTAVWAVMSNKKWPTKSHELDLIPDDREVIIIFTSPTPPEDVWEGHDAIFTRTIPPTQFVGLVTEDGTRFDPKDWKKAVEGVPQKKKSPRKEREYKQSDSSVFEELVWMYNEGNKKDKEDKEESLEELMKMGFKEKDLLDYFVNKKINRKALWKLRTHKKKD